MRVSPRRDVRGLQCRQLRQPCPPPRFAPHFGAVLRHLRPPLRLQLRQLGTLAQVRRHRLAALDQAPRGGGRDAEFARDLAGRIVALVQAPGGKRLMVDCIAPRPHGAACA
jgi:hypothetical protein